MKLYRREIAFVLNLRNLVANIHNVHVAAAVKRFNACMPDHEIKQTTVK